MKYDDRNIFVGIPLTHIVGIERSNILVHTEVAFRPTYIVIPAFLAVDFIIEDIKIGPHSQFASSVGIHASVFGVDDIVLKDRSVHQITELPLSMKMADCRPEDTICLTIFNNNAAARNFLGAIVGPPL